MLNLHNIKNSYILLHLDIFLSKNIIEGQLSIPKGWNGKNYNDVCEYSTSNQSLYMALENQENFKKYSYNKIFGETEAGKYFIKTIGQMLEFDRYYTSAYIPYGFVGWHCDSDVSGYYMMFSYSQTGDGFFKIRNPKTNEIFTEQDTPGWSLRVGKIGTTTDEQIWHCVSSKCNRYTFILVFDKEEKYNRSLSLI